MRPINAFCRKQNISRRVRNTLSNPTDDATDDSMPEELNAETRTPRPHAVRCQTLEFDDPATRCDEALPDTVSLETESQEQNYGVRKKGKESCET